MIGALLAAASLADWRSSFSTGRYDVAIVGSGPKESLLAGLLAASGRTVLQLEPSEAAGGVGTTLDLQELSERCGAEGGRERRAVRRRRGDGGKHARRVGIERNRI